jgi:hypothetical protein
MPELNKELCIKCGKKPPVFKGELWCKKCYEKLMHTDFVPRLENVMATFGEAHNLLAKSTLPDKEYMPISNLLAAAKIELFNIYWEIKNNKNHEK